TDPDVVADRDVPAGDGRLEPRLVPLVERRVLAEAVCRDVVGAVLTAEEYLDAERERAVPADREVTTGVPVRDGEVAPRVPPDVELLEIGALIEPPGLRRQDPTAEIAQPALHRTAEA